MARWAPRLALAAVAAVGVLGLLTAPGCDGWVDCPPGTAGCPCLDADGCRLPVLSCLAGSCVGGDPVCEGGHCIPAEPRCYSPCRQDLVEADGTVRSCSDEGLIEGCVGDRVCDQGSCVAGGPGGLEQPLVHACIGDTCVQRQGLVELTEAQCQEDPRCCVDSAGCPEHQVCIRGGCYSDCTRDADCAQECVKSACRQRCGAKGQGQVCGPGFVCSAQGYCQATTPGTEGDAQAEAEGEGDFELRLSEDVEGPVSLAFHPEGSSGGFVVVNNSATTQQFTLSKAEQSTLDDDGRTQVITATAGATPLAWLSIHLPDTEAGLGDRAAHRTLHVPAWSSVQVQVSEAKNEALSRWRGVLTVAHDTWGVERVQLSYDEGLDGRWTGTAYRFGQWPQDNAFMQAWERFGEGRFPLADLGYLTDAMITGAWAFPRTDELCRAAGHGDAAACAVAPGAGGRSVIEFTSDRGVSPIPGAVVELPLSLVIEAADEPGTIPGCIGDDDAAATHCQVGRIDSQESLQYPGDPQIALRFDVDPLTACAAGAGAGATQGACTLRVAGMDAPLTVGGRKRKTPGAACPDGMQEWSVPWLPAGFAAPDGDSYVECQDGQTPLAAMNPTPDGGVLHRSLELVDGLVVEQHTMLLIVREWLGLPGVDSSQATYHYAVLRRQDAGPDDLAAPDADGPDAEAAELTGGTRVRDGLAPRCDEALLDAVLPDRTPGHHLGLLTPAELERLGRAVVRGDTAADSDPEPAAVDPADEEVHYVCVWAEDVVVDAADDDVDPVSSRERMAIDSRYADGADAPCHPGAEVVYFTTPPGYDPAADPCNAPPQASCLFTLQQWVDDDATAIRLSANAASVELSDGDRPLDRPEATSASYDLTFVCDDGRPACDDDRLDLRAGKTFFQPPLTPVERLFDDSLDGAVAAAFAYHTEFQGLTGGQVGFVPDICQGEAGLLPFCYAPDEILAAQRRDECAAGVYQELTTSPPAASADPGAAAARDATLATLRDYLRDSASVRFLDNPFGDPLPVAGFGRLHAQLMLLLGDDALTEAIAARFDLAGTQVQAFEGSRFEVDGPDLTGAAGHELFKLHQAIQLYDEVLHRFHRQRQRWQGAAEVGPDAVYVGASTVTDYLGLVVTASVNVAQAWSEVARRYEGLNRPDLARAVIERAYARTAIEGQILTESLREVAHSLGPAAQEQAALQIESAQTRYRVALLDLREQHGAITDGLQLFGFAPGYVPFPPLGEFDASPVRALVALAREHADAAAADEDRALERRISLDVDAAEFQRELVSLRQRYEERLGQLCGRFVGTDGRVHPAIARYGHLSEATQDLADPCGALARGEIWIKFFDLETAQLGVQQVLQEIDIVQERIEVAKRHASERCGAGWGATTTDGADAPLTEVVLPDEAVAGSQGAELAAMRSAVDDLQGELDGIENHLRLIDSTFDTIFNLVGQAGDWGDTAAEATTSISVPLTIAVLFLVFIPDLSKAVSHLGSLGVRQGGIIASGLFGASAAIAEIAKGYQIVAKRESIREQMRAFETDRFRYDCVFFDMERRYRIEETMLETGRLELESLNALWGVQQTISELGALGRERQRLQAELADKEALAIHVAAAKNDPNIRVFRNDAIVNADHSFRRAVRTAYRATRAVEYHMAQSYPGLDRLFLVRMVRAGEINLDEYLQGLEESLYDFEERQGLADTRVLLLSVRDDAMAIPYYAADGRALSAEERIELFRAALSAPEHRDAQGQISVPFQIDDARLSPATFGHRVLSIAVDLSGSDLGDARAQATIIHEGAGSIRTRTGSRLNYALLPTPTSVNTSFNGERPFDADTSHVGGIHASVYRSFRLRERPLANSGWRLTIDPVGNPANRDINYSTLDDITVVVFYTDFTVD